MFRFVQETLVTLASVYVGVYSDSEDSDTAMLLVEVNQQAIDAGMLHEALIIAKLDWMIGGAFCDKLAVTSVTAAYEDKDLLLEDALAFCGFVKNLDVKDDDPRKAHMIWRADTPREEVIRQFYRTGIRLFAAGLLEKSTEIHKNLNNIWKKDERAGKTNEAR